MKSKKQKTVKPLTFEYPDAGYNLICFGNYMLIGDLKGDLPIKPESVKFGAYTFIPGQTNVVQLGDENDSHALWTMCKLEAGFSLFFLGTFQDGRNRMLIFEPLVDNKPRIFRRNLFGELEGSQYVALYAAFNYLSEKELHITTGAQAARCFRPTVVFAPDYSSSSK